MPLEVKPSPLPPDWETYVPKDSVPYHPSDGESWYTLAERPECQKLGMTANDLCYFNFRTRVPREINWYLHNKVGCTHTTRDGLNYRFSVSDKKNIYLPSVGAQPPVTEVPRKDPEPRLDMWFGIGGKAGTMFVVAGIETLEGLIVSVDSPHRWIALHASINRLGGGWGVTGGACLIVVTGVSQPSQLNKHQEGDWDFNVALGGKWDKVARAAQASNKFTPIIEAMARLGAKTPSGLKRLLKAEPDRYVDLIKALRMVKENLGAGASSEPKVYLIDVPWLGGGVEVSVFFGVANYEAVWDSGS